MAGDSETLRRIDAARSTGDTHALFTIGYEGHTLKSYLNLLLEAGVTVLADVRRNPISRKPGFSKKALARACDGIGVRYEHLPELGIAPEQRRGLVSQEDYDALFAEYKREALPKQTEALGAIRNWVEDGAKVALTCYERLPHRCHRHCVAEALEARFGDGFVAAHL